MKKDDVHVHVATNQKLVLFEYGLTGHALLLYRALLCAEPSSVRGARFMKCSPALEIPFHYVASRWPVGP